MSKSLCNCLQNDNRKLCKNLAVFQYVQLLRFDISKWTDLCVFVYMIWYMLDNLACHEINIYMHRHPKVIYLICCMENIIKRSWASPWKPLLIAVVEKCFGWFFIIIFHIYLFNVGTIVTNCNTNQQKIIKKTKKKNTKNCQNFT